ncbi:TPA: hypothetical protein P2R03_004280 [Aeromonas veronii]|nr:hypothetical protein [Aeromonas veronii]
MTPGVFEICFTGFGSAKKRELVALAKTSKNDEFIVRAGVTKDLDILCCGDNAGPMKIAEAHDQGCHILDEANFLLLLDTGFIQVDGKKARPEAYVPSPEICFTGFVHDPERKGKLIDIAEKFGFIVRDSVTNSVHYLCCCGDKDAHLGFAKIAHALVNGKTIVSDNEFLAVLDSGEMPETPWLYHSLFSNKKHAAELLSWIHRQAQE